MPVNQWQNPPVSSWKIIDSTGYPKTIPRLIPRHFSTCASYITMFFCCHHQFLPRSLLWEKLMNTSSFPSSQLTGPCLSNPRGGNGLVERFSPWLSFLIELILIKMFKSHSRWLLSPLKMSMIPVNTMIIAYHCQSWILFKRKLIWTWLEYFSAYSTAKEWPTDLLKHHLSRCDGEQ